LLAFTRFFLHYTSVPPEQLPTRTLRFTHHVQDINFSLVYCVEARIGVPAAKRLKTFMLRYYCFNIAQKQ